ncbi:Retrovirus-related Pol polyprotein from transposon RE1 [Bienertia sinuspersici]
MSKDDQNPSPPPRYPPFSAYYFHPNKGTGAIISPILLKGDNYEEWSRSLRNNLLAKNKLGFIDGTIAVPDKTCPDFDQWDIVNSMLVAWIFNTLNISIRSTTRFPVHVKSLSDDLRDRYTLGNGPRILELKSKIADCKQRSQFVATYYGELRKLQDELASYIKLPACSCSNASEYITMHEHEILHQFLIGLDPKKFGSSVSTLLMMDPHLLSMLSMLKLFLRRGSKLCQRLTKLNIPMLSSSLPVAIPLFVLVAVQGVKSFSIVLIVVELVVIERNVLCWWVGLIGPQGAGEVVVVVVAAVVVVVQAVALLVAWAAHGPLLLQR